MLDSKQMSLVYLMEEANNMASVCTRNVHNLHKKKTNNDVAEQLGKLFSAMKEVAEELKLDEQTVENFAMEEYNRRQNDR